MTEINNNEFIPVTIDKSHIITIGERLYKESIEFVREIVNNAYDADATPVEIVVTDDAIEIRDNGTGMDRDGLKQYLFNIGSQQKLYTPKSPIYLSFTREKLPSSSASIASHLERMDSM